MKLRNIDIENALDAISDHISELSYRMAKMNTPYYKSLLQRLDDPSFQATEEFKDLKNESDVIDSLFLKTNSLCEKLLERLRSIQEDKLC